MTLSQKLLSKTPLNVFIAICIIGVEALVGIDVNPIIFLAALAGVYFYDIVDHFVNG